MHELPQDDFYICDLCKQKEYGEPNYGYYEKPKDWSELDYNLHVCDSCEKVVKNLFDKFIKDFFSK